MSDPAGTRDQAATEAVEAYYIASQWQLMWRKFRRHHLAIVGGVILGVFYFVAIFCDFFSPYPPNQLIGDAGYHPPSRIRLFHEGRLVGPYVYGVTTEVDPEAFRRFYTEDRSVRYPLRFFTAGAEYRLLGLFPTRVRLFGVEQPGAVFLFGSDKLSRDLFSRTICAARISLSIGLLGVAS